MSKFPASALRVGLGAAVAFGVSLGLWAIETPALQQAIGVYGKRGEQAYQLWDLITCTGRGVGLVALLLVVMVELRDHARRQLVVTSAIAGGLLCNLLKVLVGRERPDGDAHSWPSGHATTAFALAFALSWGQRRPSWAVWLFAVVLAASRVFLERHWPSDIVAGLAVALIAVALCARLKTVGWGLLDHGAVLVAIGLLLAIVGLASLAVDADKVPMSRGWAVLFGLWIALRGLRALQPGIASTEEAA